MGDSFRLLSEQESAELVHVSIETIRKYRECGLIDPIIRENRTFFNEADIRTIFYGRAVCNPDSSDVSSSSPKVPDSLAGTPSTAVEGVTDAGLRSGAELATDDSRSSTTPPLAVVDGAGTAASAAAPVSPPAETPEAVSPASSDGPASSSVSPGSSPQGRTPAPQVIMADGSALATNLPPASELLEVNKGLRRQVEMLREERNWLRERIEKLEARSEREQMLLLSESENLRSAMSLAGTSFWKRALPWLRKEG